MVDPITGLPIFTDVIVFLLELGCVWHYLIFYGHSYNVTVNVTVYRKTRHNAAPFEIFFLHLRSCRRPDIELSKFYRRSLSSSRYNRPNRSLPSA